MITKEDRATLWILWNNEDPDDDTEWRDHLNEEQAALVARWDRIARAWERLQARKAAGAS